MIDRSPLGAGVAKLGKRFELTEDQVQQLREFGRTLVEDPLAPTTVREPLPVLQDHLADALVALELPELTAASVVADLGSGAGVPGIPLAICLPQTRVFLIEGSSRKCDFMRAAAETLGLGNVAVVHGRAETWQEGLGSCDAVTARALAALDIVEEYAAPLLKVGGTLIAWRGRREPEVEAAGLRAAEILGLEPLEPIKVLPYSAADNRHLHRYLKVEVTPARFPRRDGVARKRPLGKP